MAKITRKKKSSTTINEDGKVINLETGEISAPEVQPWSVKQQANFIKCVSLVEQIIEAQYNIVDYTNINAIAYSLVNFGDKGKNLFNQICLFQEDYGTSQLDDIWTQAQTKSAIKSPSKLINICKDHGFDAKISAEDNCEYFIKNPGEREKTFTEELTEKDIEEINGYGFLERSNCYYFAEWDYKDESKSCILTRRSNFILKILFHINRGKQNKRVIELVNCHGKKVTLDIETKQLTSYQGFKELTEGQGNFVFDGSPVEFSKVKSKLYELEKPSKQIDLLGWNNEGKFYAFSNGLYGDRFYPVDEHGIVALNKNNYFIPYHPGTDENSFLNEKRFCYQFSKVTFAEWSELYCKAFGQVGEITLVFGLATLFSDHIYAVRGNFPMMFLYGEGGSGKTTLGTFLQFLCGHPQPPLKVSEKANTDKSKIRKLAQYVNALIVMEEFTNEVDISAIKTLTGIYDRYGYERSNIDTKYGTETVPINSTAFITGNFYPNDDPFMQRLILADYNANRRDDVVTTAFDRLKELNREGLTEITGQLLQLRPQFVERWERCFRPQYDQFKKKVLEKSVVVPDRMIENYSVLLTTYKVLADIGVKFPFKLDDMVKFLVHTISAQAEKRDTGSVTQQWWDTVLQLANQNLIKHGREFVIHKDVPKYPNMDGDVLSIRFTEIYGFYQEKYVKTYYKPAPSKSSILQKLFESGNMLNAECKPRDMRLGSPHATTVYDFDYCKLGIDLARIAFMQEQQRKGAMEKQPLHPNFPAENAPPDQFEPTKPGVLSSQPTDFGPEPTNPPF